MILIFATSRDVSSSKVVRQLHDLGETAVLRINHDDPERRPVEIDLGDESLRLRYGEVVVELGEIRAVWYRKGNFWFDNLVGPPIEIEGHPGLSSTLNAKLANEDARARDYFHHLLATRTRTLGHAKQGQFGKLVNLSLARAVGLSTPASIVSNRRDAFLLPARAGVRLVSKAMSDGVYAFDFEKANGYTSYTEQLQADRLATLPSHIPLSLAQHQIEKEYELRIFFLDGDFYSAAIFSQADSATAVDYRKYNYARPNRMVPYQLPQDIEQKLRELFRRLQLNTGSVDMIVDRDGSHCFLEINPSGQYEGIAELCNLDLNRRIADWLVGSRG